MILGTSSFSTMPSRTFSASSISPRKHSASFTDPCLQKESTKIVKVCTPGDTPSSSISLNICAASVSLPKLHRP
uniref:Uncharacterized protein n=1 Tax=Helianthus annuus TaxID=4232 RepID=A0A251UFE4_HELAN